MAEENHDLNEEEMRVANATAKIVMDSLASAREEQIHGECHFPQERRKHLNDFIDAIDAEGADHETHIIILRVGKAMQDAFKKCTKAVMWGFILAVATLLTLMFGKVFGVGVTWGK